jgi:alkylation response protein AidB-like acyl-CoA dehydrogenase
MTLTDAEAAKVGCSFLGAEHQLVPSPTHFSSDEQLMISMAEDFCRGEVLAVADRIAKQEDGLMPSLIRKAGELGFCGADSPAEFGGLGLGKNISAHMLERLSLDASFSVTLGVTSGIGQFGLAAFGTEEQKAKYLPQLASGEWIGAYALSEPDSGSDALSLTTKAVRDGDDWLLTGTKMWISNAMWADLFLVMAKVDGEKITAFLVERTSPGLTVEREEHKLGLKGSSTARLTLDSCRVPGDNVLFEIGRGHHVALNCLNIGRFKLAAMSLGPARQAIRVAAEYAADRKQFGRSISHFGLIRKKFADMAMDHFASASVLCRTGGQIDASFAAAAPNPDGMMAASAENAVECAMTKVLASDAEARIVDEALQVFGGYGYTEEFPAAKLYRDARISKIYEGTNEINRFYISSQIERRIASGRIGPVVSDGSFIGDLTARVFGDEAVHQEVVGAKSDLAILMFAAQTCRVRGKAEGGIAAAAAERFENWANVRAAEAYQTIKSEAVSLPAPNPGHTDELAEAVLEAKSPI